MKRISLLMIIPVVLFSVSLIAYAQMPGEEKDKTDSVENAWQENVVGVKVYVNALVEQNQQLKAANEEQTRRVDELDKALKESLGKCSSATNQGIENQALKKEVEGLKRDKSTLQGQIESYKKEKPKKTSPCSDDKSKKLEKTLKDCEQEKSRVNKQLSELGIKSRQQGEEIAEFKKAEGALKAEISNQQNIQEEDAVKQLKADKAKLAEEMESLKKEGLVAVREKEISESLLRLQPKIIVDAAATVFPVVSEKSTNYELAGYNFAKSGKYTEAVVEYQKAVLANPENKDIYFNLGFIYNQLKQYAAAVGSYEKVLSIDPNDKETLYNLSKVYESLADQAKSKHYYELYLKQDQR
ncbi:MAG: tetratricopeptide repeat protein [Candidatus Omnitrophota bacterium]|nr:tetratricopeptide repeat protein [Candidatus Omnitrophota bacterium]